MERAIIEATGVRFSYKEPVLVDFQLELGAGSITLLIGLNGAGKTTALRLLAGELRPHEGRVRVMGADPALARGRRHLFFLAEVASPFRHLTAEEAVRFHLDLYGRRGPWRPRARACLDRVGLGDVLRKRASTLSKGMARRLELACLLAVDPEVWLLDEPQAGLDPLGLRFLREICREARDAGRSLVMASHALSDVPALADQVLVLDKGRTRFVGDQESLMGEIGARSWTAVGELDAFGAALTELAERHGVKLTGPEVPGGPLEDLLFREGDGS